MLTGTPEQGRVWIQAHGLTSWRAAAASLVEPFSAASATMLSGSAGRAIAAPISRVSSRSRCRLGDLADTRRSADANTDLTIIGAEAGWRDARRGASEWGV